MHDWFSIPSLFLPAVRNIFQLFTSFSHSYDAEIKKVSYPTGFDILLFCRAEHERWNQSSLFRKINSLNLDKLNGWHEQETEDGSMKHHKINEECSKIESQQIKNNHFCYFDTATSTTQNFTNFFVLRIARNVVTHLHSSEARALKTRKCS